MGGLSISVTTPAGREARRKHLGDRVLAHPAVAITLALAIVVLAAQGAAPIAVAATIASAALLAWRFRVDAGPLVLAALPAAALIASMLLDPRLQYLPLAAVAMAIGLTVAGMVWRRRLSLVMPRRAVSLLLGAYCGWAFVATLVSTDRTLSSVYLVGIVATVILAFVVMPSTINAARLRPALLRSVALVAVALAAAGFALAAGGHIVLAGRSLGVFQPTELVMFGTRTGLIVPRITGIYNTPGYQGMALALGLVAALALAPRGRFWLVGGCAVGLALFLTMDRTGWLGAALGAGSVAAFGLLRRRVDVAAMGGAILFVGLLAGLTTGTIQFIARYDVALQRYGDAARALPGFNVASGSTVVSPAPGASPAVGTGSGSGAAAEPSAGPAQAAEEPDVVVLRGGSQLGARLILWSASLQAIAERPLLGDGPGTDAVSIVPFLTGESRAYRGLTSHNTWLRTALEMGIPGMFLLGGLIALLLVELLVVSLRAGVGAPVGAIALLAGVLAMLMFESLLFGGLSYPSFAWTMAAGLGAAEVAQYRKAADRDSGPVRRS